MGLKDLHGSSGDITIGTPAPAWMLTYSDLMTQIFIFFVMLVAFATPTNEMQLLQLKKKFGQYMEREKLNEAVEYYIDSRGLVISVRSGDMFEPGSSLMVDSARLLLKKFAAFMLSYPNPVRIEGHTDRSDALSSEAGRELSASRAQAMAEYLMEELVFPSRRLSSTGYGDQYPFLSDADRDKLIKMRDELLKGVREGYLEELRRLLAQQLNEELGVERKKLLVKFYKLEAKRREARIDLDLGEKKIQLGKKSDKIIRSFSNREELGRYNKEWSPLLSEYGLDPAVIYILGAKEEFWKADFRKRIQRIIVEMGNSGEEDRARNRRVDIVIQRISAALGKKEVI
ncbi:MAG TPA: OmpA family protein [bacterium]|nr:OmpA family protein [bacterium]